MDTSSSNTVGIIEIQILKAINHIKYISKKKPCTLKIFNYLKKNYASNYDYHSVEIKSILIHKYQHKSTRINTSPTRVNTSQLDQETIIVYHSFGW